MAEKEFLSAPTSIQFLTMVVPHLGQVISEQGIPAWWGALLPQEGQTHCPAGPAPLPPPLPPPIPLPDLGPPPPGGPVPFPLGIGLPPLFHFFAYDVDFKFHRPRELYKFMLIMSFLREGRNPITF
jgi:hypothetical protein